MPRCRETAADAIGRFLERFAVALEQLAADSGDRRTCLDEAEGIVADIRTALSAEPMQTHAAARSVLRAAASLRFIADRFEIDRAYLERRFAGRVNMDRLKLPHLSVFHDVELVGFYVSPLLLWAGAALIPFALLRWLLDRYGLYRFVWHRSLFNLALYVLLVGGAMLVGNWPWL